MNDALSSDVLSPEEKAAYDEKKRSILAEESLPTESPNATSPDAMNPEVLLRQVADQVGADAETKAIALEESSANQRSMAATGQPIPELAGATGDLVADPDNAITRTATDPKKYLGSLFSILIPVLAGAAIGGKTGALYGAKGASLGALQTIEKEEEAKRQAAAAIAKEEEWRTRENYKQENREDLERLKMSPEALSAQQKAELDTFSKKEDIKMQKGMAKDLLVQADGLDASIEQARPYLAEIKAIAEKNGAIDENGIIDWGKFKVKSILPGTPDYNVMKSIDLWAMELLKQKQGSRPSDFDLKNIRAAIKGNVLAGPGGVFQLFSRALEDSQRLSDIKRKQARGYGMSNAEKDEADYLSQRHDGSTNTFGKLVEKIKIAKENGYSLDKIKSHYGSMYNKRLIKEALEYGTP